MTPPGISELLMLSFEGTDVPPDLLTRVGSAPPAGVTLFRADNIESIDQVRELTGSLQRANQQDLPLLIAVDQEGGQLLAAGEDTTAFPGNMALGAAADPDLTYRVGVAIAREL
ncbi:MAG: hypothetical protein OEX97_09355, partial [Acidimicrobiia bacterium]|nr:hypothetical protein [Acidimicrobiia bacterium]